MHWDVIAVQPRPPLGLAVTFADGTLGTVRFEPTHLTGAFAALKDPEVFARVFVDHGAVAWPGTSISHRTPCTRRSSSTVNGY
ncbi:MAG TPA: DUF2442 domain-containing protein [Acetobacteraceae bacterium]|nr:DUF2442 domain-containing protein [Acetobacteraceae bacterium]